MATSADKYDFFVSYARDDNRTGWISQFVEALVQEHEAFFGERKLTPYFDKKDIHNFSDWQLSLKDGISHSRLFLAFISPNYFASEWCRREWREWIETEISKHILSLGAQPIYVVEVPGFLSKIPSLEVQDQHTTRDVLSRIVELCKVSSAEQFISETTPMLDHLRDRREMTTEFVRPFSSDVMTDLRREDLREILKSLAEDLDQRVKDVHLAANSQSTVPAYNKFFSGRVDELLRL